MTTAEGDCAESCNKSLADYAVFEDDVLMTNFASKEGIFLLI